MKPEVVASTWWGEPWEHQICEIGRGVVEVNKEIDHEYTHEVVCPYCGNKWQDSYEQSIIGASGGRRESKEKNDEFAVTAKSRKSELLSSGRVDDNIT